MKAWTIRARIVGSFGAVLALMLVMTGVAYTRLADVETQAVSIADNSLPVLRITGQIVAEQISNYSLTQELALGAERARRDQLRAAVLTSRERLNALADQYSALLTSPEDHQKFGEFKTAESAYTAAQDRLLSAALDSRQDDNLRRTLDTDVYPALNRAQAAADVLVEHEKSDAHESTQLIVAAVGRSMREMLAVAAAGLITACIFGFFLLRAISKPFAQLTSALDVMRTGDLSVRLNLMRRDEFGTVVAGFNRMADELAAIVGQVQRSGIQVNASVSEIATTAREQQATATEIAATTTEIGATSRQISATSKSLVGTMNEVSSVAEQSAALAGHGQTGLTNMEETMRHVMDAATSITAKLAVLSEKAGNISQVVTTITKVADQTNLLSLNAAIEAEKAGEHGRGFAVVATEIRRLADQTAVATFDIEQMVKEIQTAVAGGVMAMDKFSDEVRRGMHDVQQIGGQLSQVIQQVQALAPRVESVNEGMQTQAMSAEQITQALSQLSEAAQQTVDSLRQSGTAIDELNKVATGLRSGVSRFTLAA